MGAMKVAGILKKGVVRREISTTSEPPDRSSLEVAVIEMHRRYEWISGMQNHGSPGGKPWMPFGFRPLFED